MNGIKKIYNKLPVIALLGSFIFLFFIIFFSNPKNNIAAVLLFFPALYIFLVSLVLVLIKLTPGVRIGKVRKYQVAVCIAGFILGFMFFTSHSLNVVNASVLVAIVLGAAFYIDKRLSAF